MATEAQPVGGFQQAELSNELASQWRRLTRVATAVALITAPALVVWFNQTQGWAWYWSILAALLVVVCFRGAFDLLFHRLIPRPSLFGLESQQLREEDVVARRRVWFWRFWLKITVIFVVVGALFYAFGGAGYLVGILPLLLIFPFYMIMNFAILFGPLLIMNLSQIQALRARGRRVGREARGRPWAGGGEGGGAPGRLHLAVRRRIRARRRQA